MGSLLRDSFGKEVGKRKWCETFAGPLVRRLSRSGGLSFIFSTEMLFFCAFFLCFSGAPEHKKKKKTQFIPQKKTKFIPRKKAQKNTSHTTKKTQFISQKKHKKNTNHSRKKHTTTKKHNSYHKKQKTKSFSFLFLLQFLLFFCFFSFFSASFLLFFCFWTVQPGPAQFQPLSQPAPQASSPLASQRPSAPRLSPSPGPVQQPRPFICIVHSHSIVLLSALRWATS
jgi:hypothetical protein